MINWEPKLFKDIAQFPPKVPMVKGQTYSFIPMEDVSGNYKYVAPTNEKEWTGGGGAKFENGDTLFARITPCLQNGKIAQAKDLKDGKGFGSTEYFIFRGIDKISDSDFIYYIAQTDEFRKYAIGSMVGASGRQRADAKFVGNFELKCPPLPTQRKIASILSAYDDLIENNLKRIKLLEEIAQRTYEEWFVKFRIDGKQLKLNKDTGLPEGWERKVIGDMIEVGRGSSPRPIANQKYFVGGTIPWLKIADATASNIFIHKTKEHVNEFGASFSRKLKPGSLIVAASGTLGFPMFLSVEACIHDGWIYFDGITEELKEYFYYSFIGLRKHFESISYGAAIQNINTGIVKSAAFILPPKNTLIEFKKVAGPLFKNIELIQNQNRLLKESRDILLPRLMSGVIEVG
jgi:type I restriction enzyme S subunit